MKAIIEVGSNIKVKSRWVERRIVVIPRKPEDTKIQAPSSAAIHAVAG